MTTPIPPNAFAPRANVDDPACPPWRFGLLSVATIIDSTDPHERNGVKYKPRACVADVASIEDGCDTLDAPNRKTPTDLDDQNVEVQGDPFHLYAYLSCKTTTLDAMTEEARGYFEMGEQCAVEREIWTRVLASGGCEVLNATPDAAGALSVIAGIAALESHMSANYTCRPTFHSDRATVPYAVADEQLVVVGGSLSTFLGSAWAAYGCSPNTGPDGEPAPDGHAWLYATSALTIRRFPIDVYPIETGHRLARNANGDRTNEPIALAERTYVPSVECACAAVLVCLGCG